MERSSSIVDDDSLLSMLRRRKKVVAYEDNMSILSWEETSFMVAVRDNETCVGTCTKNMDDVNDMDCTNFPAIAM